MGKVRKSYQQGLKDGQILGIENLREQLFEYRTLVEAISLGEDKTESQKDRLLGGVAAIDSMLEVSKGLLDTLQTDGELDEQ
jgi:hypothetical protein